MAATFDAMFANSPAETKTTTEKGFVEGFANQIGDIGAIMIAILVGRALHDSAGRRQHDGAVGARAHERAGRAQDARLLRTARSWRWCSPSRCSSRSLGGGARASAVAWLIVQRGDPTGGMLPIFVLPPRDMCDRRRADGRCWACSPALLPAHGGHAAAHHRRAAEELT